MLRKKTKYQICQSRKGEVRCRTAIDLDEALGMGTWLKQNNKDGGVWIEVRGGCEMDLVCDTEKCSAFPRGPGLGGVKRRRTKKR